MKAICLLAVKCQKTATVYLDCRCRTLCGAKCNHGLWFWLFWQRGRIHKLACPLLFRPLASRKRPGGTA